MGNKKVIAIEFETEKGHADVAHRLADLVYSAGLLANIDFDAYTKGFKPPTWPATKVKVRIEHPRR